MGEQRNFLGEVGGGEEKVGELWKDAQRGMWHSLGREDDVTFEETETAHRVERDNEEDVAGV